MKSNRLPVSVVALSLVLAFGPAGAHSDHELGAVTFPTSCSAQVQPEFERALAMLHSFWFTAAGPAFAKVMEQDPGCAIAAWGIAVNLLGNSLGAAPPLKDMQAASEVLDKARAIGAKTQRERDWIEAIGAYYKDYERTPTEARLAAYTRAMEEMTRRYPDDDEVWIYYALALQASAPKADKTYANQLKSAEILEKQFARSPQHPGAAHYLIHAYDFPSLAQRGLPAARKYASIAPASAHARHMPSHVYSMLGMWEDSIASNRSSVEIQPDYYHARDFMVYAHLQLGQDTQARAAIAQAAEALTRLPAPSQGSRNSVAAMPARYALERGDWAAAAALPVTSNDWAYADSLTRFARGLGMARNGDVAGAKGEIEALKGLRQTLESAKQAYWVARVDEEMMAVAAWIAQAEGDRAQAEKLLRAAADGEDASIKHIAMENRLYPMREMLGDLLRQIRKPAAALKEYEAALTENPNRYRGLYGGAVAARAAGNQQAAKGYFQKLTALTKNADTARPEVALAKEYLAGQ